jgi:cytochrome c-type biogenesis protein CcmF
MVFGQILIGLAFVSAVLSVLGYGYYFKKQDEKKLNLASKSYYILFTSLFLASSYLLYQILTHNYQVNYVYSYSSNSLPSFYLISTFWAGQEGTFLLWLLLSVTFGLFIIKQHAKKNPLVMVVKRDVRSFYYQTTCEEESPGYGYYSFSEYISSYYPIEKKPICHDLGCS